MGRSSSKPAAQLPTPTRMAHHRSPPATLLTPTRMAHQRSSPATLLTLEAQEDETRLGKSESWKAVKDRKYTSERSLWAALKDGATVLLKGSWLVEFAKKGQKLPRRQDLPARAVWNVAELEKRGTTMGAEGKNKVHFMALSYCWMESAHPDPGGEQMKTVASVIEKRLKLPRRLKRFQCYDVAIFIDYACLPQHPRSPEDQWAFDRGLNDVSLWYAHDRMTVLLLTCFPKSRVDKMVAYADRGWPSFEKAVASWMKMSDHILDLQFLDSRNDNLSQEARSHGVRPGPCCDWEDITWKCRSKCISPPNLEAFIIEIGTKTFANGADAEFVKDKYAQVVSESLYRPALVGWNV